MIFLAVFVTGLVMKSYDYEAGNIIVGISVLFMAFILMPVFIFYRYQKGKYKKYVLDTKKKNPFKLDKDQLI